MTMRGRKPKPAALKLIEGNLGKRPIGGAAPAPETVILPPPAILNEVGKRVWRAKVKELTRWGLFTRLDTEWLAGYCAAWQDVVWARNKIRKLGHTAKTPNGMVMQNVYLQIETRGWAGIRAFGAGFGLNPSDRERLKGTQQGDLFEGFNDQPSGDPWDEF